VEEKRGGGGGVYADGGDGVQQVGQGLRYSGIFGQTGRSNLSEADAPCRIEWNAPGLHGRNGAVVVSCSSCILASQQSRCVGVVLDMFAPVAPSRDTPRLALRTASPLEMCWVHKITNETRLYRKLDIAYSNVSACPLDICYRSIKRM
jgi:hypothetical protein